MQGVPRRFTWHQYKPKKTATELDKPKADAEFEKGNLSLCHSLIWDWQRPGNSSLPVNLLHWDGEWGKWNKSLRFSHTSPDCYQGQHLFALPKQLESSGQGSKSPARSQNCCISLALLGNMLFVLEKSLNSAAPRLLLFQHSVTILYEVCVIHQAKKESAYVHKGFCLTEWVFPTSNEIVLCLCGNASDLWESLLTGLFVILPGHLGTGN